MSSCYWYHDGSCDCCCKEVAMCSNFKELQDTDVVEVREDDNFNEHLIETLDRYKRRFKSCPCSMVV